VDTARIDPFVSSIMEQFAGRQVVGIWLPVAIIGAYFGVVWLLVRVVHGRKVMETRWLNVCGVAILFAGTGYALAWAAGPAPRREVFDIWVAKGTSPSQTLRVADYLSILPAARGDSAVRIKGRRIQVVPTREAGASVIDSVVDYEGSTVRYMAEKARLRTLHLEGQIDLPGLSVRASAGPEALVVELENQSSYDFDKSFFKLGRRVLPVGRLAQRERRTIEFRPGAGLADSYESDAIQDASGRLRHSILRSLFVDPATLTEDELLARVYRGSEQGTSSGSIFAGWVNRSPLDVSWEDREGTTNSHALGLVAIEPEWENAETQFLVPRGGMTIRLRDQGVSQYYFGKSVFRGNRPVSSPMAIEFAVPLWAQPAEIDQATLFVDFVAEAYRLIVKSGDERLPIPEVPSGRFALPPSALSSQNGGAITLHLVVEPRAEFAGDLAREGHRWSLREFELECLCRPLSEEHD
jgi:hypothetical protein